MSRDSMGIIMASHVKNYIAGERPSTSEVPANIQDVVGEYARNAGGAGGDLRACGDGDPGAGL
jgi:hypothetical protein